MLSYTDLYEILRKEKYSEVLQPLSKEFLSQVKEYLHDKKDQSSSEHDLFQDALAKSKKQLENSIAIFKELMLRRKKKLLNLVFVATETGIMKRDYENMLAFEREIFDVLVKTFEEGDKQLLQILHGKSDEKISQALVIFSQNVDQFVDMSGNIIGPFVAGELAHLDTSVSEVLVSGDKARFVDE